MAWSLNFFVVNLVFKTLSMKRFLMVFIVIFSAILILNSFRSKYQTSIVGRVNPVGGANVADLANMDPLVLAVDLAEIVFQRKYLNLGLPGGRGLGLGEYRHGKG